MSPSPPSLTQIIASCEPPGDPAVNWLPMEASSSKIVVRQTFLDRSREVAARVTIQCLDASGVEDPLSTTAGRIAERSIGDLPGSYRGATGRHGGEQARRTSPDSQWKVTGDHGEASDSGWQQQGPSSGPCRPALSAAQVASGLSGSAMFVNGAAMQVSAGRVFI